MDLKEPNGPTNSLEVELDEFLSLSTIVENNRGNSFVLAQQDSEYPYVCDGILEEKSILRDPLIALSKDINFNPYSPLVLSAETFHSKGSNPHKDLIINCFTPNDWKIYMKLSSYATNKTFSFFFNSAKENRVLERTSDLEDLFLRSMDILSYEAKRPKIKLSVD